MHKISISFIVLLSLGILVGLFTFSTETDESPEKSYYEHYKSDYKIFSPPMPREVNFAGEPAPINIYYVNEQLEREILVNTYWHSNTLLLFKRANRWFPVIEPILKANNIPDDFKYLALIESGLSQAVSSAGARGFWQFMKPTGISYGLEINKEVDERYHIEKSTLAACKYLHDAYKKFGSWTLVAASYNVGMGGLNKQMDLQKVDSYYELSLNSETARYVYRIMAVKTIFSHPSKYGFQLRKSDLYPTLETEELNIDSSYVNWADFAKTKNISYRMLKELNPWLRTPSLHNSYGKTYSIKLPAESMYEYTKLKRRMSNRTGVFGEQK